MEESNTISAPSRFTGRAPALILGLPAPAVLLATAMAILLVGSWTIRAWPLLSVFRLPDNDDMMRLAEVRDWLSGQAFADLSQHRLGPVGGASMHWSRLADIGPAALIWVLTPLLGRTGAEQAMLPLYPGILFLIAILIGARIVRRLEPRATMIGVLVLSLTYPGDSLFIPGRIDHHALQIVLTLWFVERLVALPRWQAGAGAGLAAALSLAVGLETLPLVLAGMIALFWRFLSRPVSPERFVDRSLLAFAIALGGATALFLQTLRPLVWPREWCDGFTPASTSATLIAAAYFAILAVVAPRLTDWRHRLAAGAALGVLALPLVYQTSSICLSGPYGSIDPMLQRLWMSKVGEALGMFQQESIGMAISFGGFGVASLIALILLWRQGAVRSGRWQTFAIILTLGVLLTLVQIRATYVVSVLGGVALAIWICRVRANSQSMLARVGVWILGTGVFYNQLGAAVGSMLSPVVLTPQPSVAFCTGPRSLAALNRLSTGRVVAPLDSAAYIIGGTQHSVIDAPYHRNNKGNVAAYRFFLGPTDAAEPIARQWGINYVVLCGSSFAELGKMIDDRHRLIGALRANRIPTWLEPVRRSRLGMTIYVVKPRLPRATIPH